jgi:hypothetical protein
LDLYCWSESFSIRAFSDPLTAAAKSANSCSSFSRCSRTNFLFCQSFSFSALTRSSSMSSRRRLHPDASSFAMAFWESCNCSSNVSVSNGKENTGLICLCEKPATCTVFGTPSSSSVLLIPDLTDGPRWQLWLPQYCRTILQSSVESPAPGASSAHISQPSGIKKVKSE